MVTSLAGARSSPLSPVGRFRYRWLRAESRPSARIQRYRNRPTGVSGDERATTNEVTIAVQVRYVDQKRDSVLVDQSFRGASSYDPVEAGLQGERQAAQNALQNVADDIFSTATSNW